VLVSTLLRIILSLLSLESVETEGLKKADGTSKFIGVVAPRLFPVYTGTSYSQRALHLCPPSVAGYAEQKAGGHPFIFVSRL
jgi:hypothetical protein